MLFTTAVSCPFVVKDIKKTYLGHAHSERQRTCYSYAVREPELFCACGFEYICSYARTHAHTHSLSHTQTPHESGSQKDRRAG